MNSLDDDSSRAGSLDLGSHRNKEIGEILDLRFLGGTVDHRRALRKRGGHHDIVGAQHGGTKSATQVDRGAAQFRCQHFNIASLDSNRRPERFETAQVQVDRTVPDDAAAGQRNRGLFFPAQQRAQDANRCAHFSDDVVGRLGEDLFRFHGHRAAGPLYFATELTKDSEHIMDIAKIRDPRDDTRLLRQQRGGQNRKSGILGPADAD